MFEHTNALKYRLMNRKKTNYFVT